MGRGGRAGRRRGLLKLRRNQEPQRPESQAPEQLPPPDQAVEQATQAEQTQVGQQSEVVAPNVQSEPPDADNAAHNVPTDPGLGDSQVDTRQPPRGPIVRMYSTPDLIRTLCPPGAFVSIDIPGVRWKPTFGSKRLPSVGFGPHGHYNRRTGLAKALDDLWSMHAGQRPASAFLSAIPEEAWQGLLDDNLVEEGRRRAKRPRM